MHQAGIENPGTMAAVLGLDDDQVEVACRARRRRRVGRQLQRPRPGRHRRVARGRRRGRRRAKELGAKKVMPLPVGGRVPHAVHGAGPRPAAQGDRRGRPARHRGAGRSPTSTPLAHDTGAEWASLLSAQLCSPVRWKHCLLTLDDARRHRLRRARPGRRAHRHGQAHGRRARAPSSVVDARRARQAARVGQRRRRPRGRRPARGRAPLRHRAARRQPGGRRVHARSPTSPTARASTSATCSATSATHEVRSPFAGVAAELHRRRRRAGHAQPTHRLAADGLTCQHYLPESAAP